MATPPLHLSLFGGFLPPVPGPIHLPDLQQGFLSTQLTENPQPLAHGREALQVPSLWMRQGLQCSQQHEEARTWLPQLRVQHILFTLIYTRIDNNNLPIMSFLRYGFNPARIREGKESR